MRWPLSKEWLNAHTPEGWKRRFVQEKQPKTETGVRPENRRLFIMGYGLCLILLLVDANAIFKVLGRGGKANAPVDIVGIWTTDDERYVDRAMEFTDSTVVFYTGEGASVSYPISDVAVEEENYIHYYTMEYGTGDGAGILAFSFTNLPADLIRLRNQKDIAWMRAGADSSTVTDSTTSTDSVGAAAP